VVGVIRQVRTQHKTPPRQAVDCSFQGAAECAATIDAHKDLIGTLAAINLVAAGPDVEQPEGSAVALLGPNKLFLHGLIDTDAEGQRLSKRLEELKKSVTTLEGRLSNKSYTDKAPAHLVQQTRDQLADAQRERDSVEQQLNALNE
jgi:valyl-tRNA synthetase